MANLHQCNRAGVWKLHRKSPAFHSHSAVLVSPLCDQKEYEDILEKKKKKIFKAPEELSTWQKRSHSTGHRGVSGETVQAKGSTAKTQNRKMGKVTKADSSYFCEVVYHSLLFQFPLQPPLPLQLQLGCRFYNSSLHGVHSHLWMH